MNLQERQHLLSEKTQLERMLDDLPASCIIDRMSLEARKSQVEEELANAPAPTREPVRAYLTFRGKPIVGNYGVFAEFGATAVNDFTDAVAAVGASQTAALGSRGVLPNREAYQLLITGTAKGSFGFTLEEAPKETGDYPEVSEVAHALEQTRVIMAASLESDDDLGEAIVDADPRALDALHKFLQTLADQEAVCAFEYQGSVFRFVDVRQVKRSAERLRQDNIHEKNEHYTGQFLGVLPKRRAFEFEVADSAEIITGKVGPQMEDAGHLNAQLGKRLRISVNARSVGSGSPRYTLIGYEDAEIKEAQNG